MCRGIVGKRLQGEQRTVSGSYSFVPTHPKQQFPRSPYLLVLNLEVEMSTEPVIEGGLVDIACCLELKRSGESRALGTRWKDQTSLLQVKLAQTREYRIVPVTPFSA